LLSRKNYFIFNIKFFLLNHFIVVIIEQYYA